MNSFEINPWETEEVQHMDKLHATSNCDDCDYQDVSDSGSEYLADCPFRTCPNCGAPVGGNEDIQEWGDWS